MCSLPSRSSLLLLLLLLLGWLAGRQARGRAGRMVRRLGHSLPRLRSLVLFVCQPAGLAASLSVRPSVGSCTRYSPKDIFCATIAFYGAPSDDTHVLRESLREEVPSKPPNFDH